MNNDQLQQEIGKLDLRTSKRFGELEKNHTERVESNAKIFTDIGERLKELEKGRDWQRLLNTQLRENIKKLSKEPEPKVTGKFIDWIRSLKDKK